MSDEGLPIRTQGFAPGEPWPDAAERQAWTERRLAAPERRGTIIEDLLTVMDNVRVLRKESHNTQGWDFRGIDALLNAVGPEFRAAGIVPSSRILKASHRDITTAGNKIQRECTLTIQYIFTARDGSTFPTEVEAESADSSDKATGQAMSQGYKTALLQMLALPTDEVDPDSKNIERSEPEEDPDEIAVENGWMSAEDRESAWNDLRKATAEAGEEIRDEIAAWAKELGFTKLTFRKSQADTWDSMLPSLDGSEPF